MDVRIAPYEEWMRPRIAELFHRHYGMSRGAFLDHFHRFYEHPYQRARCLRVAAVDGGVVAGFIGFCFWPYVFDGRRLDSFQACDGLVDVRYRGRGVLRQMMQWAGEQRGADFFTGFPVQASREAFVRCGWENILLQHDAVADPRAAARAEISIVDRARFPGVAHNYSERHEYFASRGVVFELKRSRRKGLLRELIVGDVHAGEGADVRGAFGDLVHKA